ncbi:hypothetical protein AGMMS49928_03690 [Spirochaetia bacterium]|nr:hypothetical protein AGMMS49928_03690 [Spirochaetia bacterium]
MAKGLFFGGLLTLIFFTPLFAQGRILPGDERVAEQYLGWAEAALAAGRRTEALAALERGADFSSESSDISYLLARLRFEEGKSAGQVLEALGRGREADRWKKYSAAEGRLLEAEVLIRLRHYEKALEVLSALPDSAAKTRLRLLAVKNHPDGGLFIKTLAETLDAYPRDTWPLRLFFTHYADRLPLGIEGDLLSVMLQRLPLLLDDDPDLAWLCFPFITDLNEALRLAAAYRAEGNRNAAAIPALLSLGIITEEDAAAELFEPSAEKTERILDKDLILKTGRLLLTDSSVNLFRRNLLTFSGVITEDVDGDGYAEVFARYSAGSITEYSLDTDQDGLPEIKIFFGAGIPFRAEAAVLPEISAGGVFAYPLEDSDRLIAHIHWERYPAVLESALEGLRFIPRPRDFFYAPVQMQDLGGTGFLFPSGDAQRARLSRQTLLSFAAALEKPSGEFTGALERVELDRGIPQRAREYLDRRIISETEFSRGRPVLQRIDLDLDGRLETIRYFRQSAGAGFPIEYSMSDWDGDGIFETAEQHSFNSPDFPGSYIIRSWDINRDGIRETETRTEK